MSQNVQEHHSWQAIRVHKKEQQEKRAIKKEVVEKVEVVREEKKKQKETKPKENYRPKVTFYIGDKVRMFDGKAVGTIDTLEKKKAIVNYYQSIIINSIFHFIPCLIIKLIRLFPSQTSFLVIHNCSEENFRFEFERQ